MDNLFKKLNFVLALIGALAPIGYLIGLNFYQGKLHAYGISSIPFAISTQDIYIMAYYAIFYMLTSIGDYIKELLNILFTIYGFLTALSIIGIATLVIYFLIKPSFDDKDKTRNKYIIKIKSFLSHLHWKNNYFTRALGITGALSYLLFSFIYLLISAPVLYIALPYVAFHQGENTEKENRDGYLKNGCTQEKNQIFQNCYSLKQKNGDVMVEGLLITQSKDMIVFFTKEGSYISELPKDAILIKPLIK